MYTREVQSTGKPHGIAVDMWAVGVLTLQLVSGFDGDILGSRAVDNWSDKEIEDLALEANFQRIGSENGPISQIGLDFIIACLNLQPRERATAAGAAKHAWFRESQKEVLLFKEREKKLAWKPRGIVIPAMVRLKDIHPEAHQEATVEPEPNTRLQNGLVSSSLVPDSVEDPQSAGDTDQQSFVWLKQRAETAVGAERSYSMINYRSTTVA